MSRRKCDTAKYQRRMKKQRLNRIIRLQKAADFEALVKARQGNAGWLLECHRRELLRVLKARMAQLPRQRAPVICPLCNTPFTAEDNKTKNVMVGEWKNKICPVHRTCPTEVKE